MGKWKGIGKGNKGSKGNEQGEMRKATGMRHVRLNDTSCIIIIIGMNVVVNLNSV